MRIAFKVLRWLAIAVGLTVAVALSAAYWMLSGSRARLTGRCMVPGLTTEVTVDRDDRGTPTINARSPVDVAAALGFVHAQDRFFQMDLMRRRAAGELAEILGKAAIVSDKKTRVHAFRRRAEQAVARLTVRERNSLEAYVKGVNAGLAALRNRPFEYYLLNETPRPWSPEDTLLVAYSLYLELQDADGWYDAAREQLQQRFSRDVYEFFVHNGSRWDAALDDSALPMRAIPGPAQFMTLKTDGQTSAMPVFEPSLQAGSSAWAATDSKRAILSNDPHLRLGVPNIWYRAAWSYFDGGGLRYVCGATIPGMPLMVVGSNRRVVWGLANCQIDTTDLVRIESPAGHPEQYQTADGPRLIERRTETILVKGGSSVPLTIEQTEWGPIVATDAAGQRLALNWAAHADAAVNLRLADLEMADTLDAALVARNAVRCPAMNLILADDKGRIGWTLVGLLPRRSGYRGDTPVSFATGEARLDFIGADGYPTVVDPPAQRVWAANNRFLGDSASLALGSNGMAEGARAKQIKERLLGARTLDGPAMLGIQLDNEAIFIRRWRDLFLQIIATRGKIDDPLDAQAVAAVRSWDGHATKDSIGYRVVRDFKNAATQRVYKRLLQSCYKATPSFNYSCFAFEEPIWLLVQEKPRYLADPTFGSWEAELVQSFKDVLAGYRRAYGSAPRPEQLSWGARNTLAIRHPFAGRLGWFGYLLNMPATAVDGDRDMPAVATPNFGASLRMIVEPGNEVHGLFAMPCGQSGHPLSEYYRKGHDEWARGAAGPFLPGTTVHSLLLQSAGVN